MIPEKRKTPRTANRNKKRKSRAPTLASSGIANKNVFKIFYRFLAFWMSLSTRRMRKALTTVVKAPTLMSKT